MPNVNASAFQIYNVDCLDFMRGMEAGSVDAVVTDPPYGMGYASNPIVGKGKTQSNHVSKNWDNSRADICHVVSIGRKTVIWGGNYYELPSSRCWFVWYKRDAPPSMADVELAWCSEDGNSRLFDWPIAATNSERVGHPTQKPLALMRWCIELVSNPGDLIFDPFMGSGTTGVACMQLGRRFIGCEIDPNYYAIAERRIGEAAAQGQLFTPETEAEVARQATLGV